MTPPYIPMTPTPDHGEPWYKKTHRTPMGDTGGYDEHLLLCQGDRCIAERWLPDDEDEADFDRLISCANACAGMVDPEKEIAAMREAIVVADKAIRMLNHEGMCFCDAQYATNAGSHPRHSDECVQANVALAKLKPIINQ